MNDDSRAYTYPQYDCRSIYDFHPQYNPDRVPYSWEKLDDVEEFGIRQEIAMSMYTDGLISKIENRYDAEADVPSAYNHPMVSVTEYQLLEIIKDLKERIETLEAYVEREDLKKGYGAMDFYRAITGEDDAGLS